MSCSYLAYFSSIVNRNLMHALYRFPVVVPLLFPQNSKQAYLITQDHVWIAFSLSDTISILIPGSLNAPHFQSRLPPLSWSTAHQRCVRAGYPVDCHQDSRH